MRAILQPTSISDAVVWYGKLMLSKIDWLPKHAGRRTADDIGRSKRVLCWCFWDQICLSWLDYVRNAPILCIKKYLYSLTIFFVAGAKKEFI